MSRTPSQNRDELERNLPTDWQPLRDSLYDTESDQSLRFDDVDQLDDNATLSIPPEVALPPWGLPLRDFSPSRATTDSPFHHFTIKSSGGESSQPLDSLLSLGFQSTLPLDEHGSRRPSAPTTAPLPKVGDTANGFLLLSILGRGAFATVYLAEQLELGRRLVALKVSKAEGEEPQILAKLQHTHIVPIYSVFDDKISGLRFLCMPYLGGANLAQVLEAAEDHEKGTGISQKSLVAALDEVGRRFQSQNGPIQSLLNEYQSRTSFRSRMKTSNVVGPRSIGGLNPTGWELGRTRSPSGKLPSFSAWKWPTILERFSRRSRDASIFPNVDEVDFDQPARLFLREANTVQAAVWLVARLAEGLEHAHSRGMLHRDLKPSNILVARDGTPMLLDFNLSSEIRPKSSEESVKVMLGGTLPYMSPEHLEAFNPKGSTTADAVTERSDIYALGLILHEMLAGSHPFPEIAVRLSLLDTLKVLWQQRQVVPSIHEARPDVPWSIDAVLKKCLAPDPSKRYASARELSEDLSCYLDDRPMKHTREPSLKERIGKWKRRNPKLCGYGSIGAFALAGFIILGVLLMLMSSNMQTLSARLKFQTFESHFTECRFLLNLQSGPTEHLSRGVTMVGKTLESEEIGSNGDFQDRSWVRHLTIAEQRLVREQTSELLLLQARSKIDLSQRSGNETEHRQMLELGVKLLDLAGKIDPKPPAVLYDDLARYQTALGRADLAALSRQRSLEHEPSSVRDFQLLGSSFLARNEIPKAKAALQKAIDLDPKAYWAWFTLGHCHFEEKLYLEAAGDFAVCVALEPKFPWSYMNRGLCLARSGRLSEAKACYLRAIEYNPRFAEAWVNLSLADLELNDLKGAERAIGEAQSLGRKETSLLAVLGEIKARLGKGDEAEAIFTKLLSANRDDLTVLNARGIFRIKANPKGAEADFSRVIALDPENARAHFGLAMMKRKTDPQSALKAVEAALKTDPNFLDALQLRALLKGRLGIVSAVDDAERLARVETANRLYNASCALALLAAKVPDPALIDRGLDFLQRAVELGFSTEAAARDSDLKALASSDRFQAILRRRRPAAG